MPQRRATRPPFNRRTRQAQKRAYWQLLGKIRRVAPVLGGRFYTRHYMHGENGWADVFFLGNRKPIYYNLCIQTASYAYKELVSSRAWELSYELAPLDLDLSISERTAKDPVSGLYVTSPREPYRYPELNDMTRYEWAQAENQRIADSLEIQVFEHWTLRREYHSGIGLHATIDVPFVTIEAVNAFIERFLASEANFTGKTPRSFRFDEIPYWGLESNAICDPGDWANEAKSEQESESSN
ncbi:hypothetical protein RQP54_06840 [Curvibacter sp. APW13]|uniref:hypothetical protein n=1 Tax=Curvibacter sp. APW13 TaxID=3077236 RepID=UPI0028DE9619|nr:hypothetical protein [Curvibacter sp. APW13]MDT8990580.1 hypothetical protein [Curvibacter sp. APW13]